MEQPIETPEVEMKPTEPEPPKRRAFVAASVRAKQRGQDPKQLITE